LPHASKTNVRQNWPVVYMALDERELDYETMILMALATILRRPVILISA
jgi:hypothetical protein